MQVSRQDEGRQKSTQQAEQDGVSQCLALGQTEKESVQCESQGTQRDSEDQPGKQCCRLSLNINMNCEQRDEPGRGEKEKKSERNPAHGTPEQRVTIELLQWSPCPGTKESSAQTLNGKRNTVNSKGRKHEEAEQDGVGSQQRCSQQGTPVGKECEGSDQAQGPDEDVAVQRNERPEAMPFQELTMPPGSRGFPA